jgi:hypothetical protein
MQRIGRGFVFVSAVLWIVAGSVVFFSPRTGDPPRVAGVETGPPRVAHVINPPAQARMQAAAVNVFMDQKSRSNTDIVPEAWYVRAFGGFGVMFRNLIPGNSKSTNSSLAQISESTRVLPPACTISIIPNSVPHGGSATITWTSRNADHIVFQGIGEVARSGSISIDEITSTRAFALAVAGTEGSSSCYTVVNVEPLIVEEPTCVISVHPGAIKRGESVNIAWGSENASSATLTGQGTVATIGGVVLTPAETTTYTLSVASEHGDTAFCDAEVVVN